MSATRAEDATSPPPPLVAVDRVQTGCFLIAVSLLLCPILVNTLAFAFPLLELRRSDLIWLRFLYVPAEVLLIFGVFSLTAVVAERNVRARRSPLGIALCVLVIVDGACGLYKNAIVMGGWRVPIDVQAISLIVRTLFFLGTMFFASGICDRFGARRMARSFRLIVGLSLCWSAVDTATSVWSSVAEPTSSIFVLLLLLEQIILVWAAMRFWQMRKLLPAMIAGKCLSCGYRLEGLTESRCPECGCSFGPQRSS